MDQVFKAMKSVFLPSQRQVAPFEFLQSDCFDLVKLKNVVFIDNRFPNCFDQVLHYFASGFLKSSNTCLIFQYYPANFTEIRKVCDSRGINWCCFAERRFIPKLVDKLILYPFNSASNAYIVANRTCYHALLMHGESNKVACIKPLARLYDYLLVAGDIACERLVEYGILSLDDIQRGRVIKLGDTVMGDFGQIRLQNIETGDPVLGYFPTWEGGNEEENLCSLKEIYPVLLEALSLLESKHVVMHFHPHTAERDFDYKNYVYGLIHKLLEQNIKVSYQVINKPTKFEISLKSSFSKVEWRENSDPLLISAALVDVSALEAVLDAKLIPNVVYIPTDKIIAAPELYWNKKPKQQILGLNSGLAGAAFNMNVKTAKIYRDSLIGHAEPALKTMVHAEKLDWLNEYVRRTKF